MDGPLFDTLLECVGWMVLGHLGHQTFGNQKLGALDICSDDTKVIRLFCAWTFDAQTFDHQTLVSLYTWVIGHLDSANLARGLLVIGHLIIGYLVIRNLFIGHLSH